MMAKQIWLGIVVALGTSAGACASATEQGDPAGQDEPGTSEAAATAATSFRVPLVETIRRGRTEVRRLLERRNAQAARYGIAPFPKYVTVTPRTGTTAFQEAMVRVDQLNAKILAADPDADEIEMVSYGSGYEYSVGSGTTATRFCYTGDPHKAIDFLLTMGDSVLSDQYTLHAWRYKTKKFMGVDDPHTEISTDDEADITAGFPEVWTEWRGRGEAILTLNSVSDGGEESLETIIPRCR